MSFSVFDYVFIIGLEEGKFPLSRAMDSIDEMEEERRLMYVAVTRAKKKLYLTRAKSRFMYGSRDNQQASRFIKEMDLIKPVAPIQKSYGYSSSYESKYSGNSYSDYASYQKVSNTYNPPKSNSNGLSNLQNLMNNKLNTQKKSFDEYKVGVQVLHTKFGVGTIIKTDNAGGNNYVSVDFGTLGVKTLSLNFAPLQILKK